MSILIRELKVKEVSSIKILSWNILAPELLFYFWRSSYGLKT